MIGPRQLAGRAGRTRDPRYGRCYLGTLGWIVRHQADREHGDWHRWVDDRGRGTGDESGEWKDPYHQGRALIECLELLRPAPAASRAAPI